MCGIINSVPKTKSELDEMFESYVSKYAKKSGISIDEAKTHKLVLEYKSYLEHEFGGRI